MQTYRKQRAWRVLGACLLAVLLLFGADRRTEAAAPVADAFDISLTYGYDNTVKYNRDAAFHVFLIVRRQRIHADIGYLAGKGFSE